MKKKCKKCHGNDYFVLFISECDYQIELSIPSSSMISISSSSSWSCKITDTQDEVRSQIIKNNDFL